MSIFSESLTSRAIAPAIILMSSLAFLNACGGAVQGDRFVLDMPGGNSTPGEMNINDFSEENSIVVRCGLFEVGENTITIETSKSKKMRAAMLMFAAPSQTANENGSLMQVFAAPITGKEYEYDVSMGRFYAVDRVQAQVIIDEYGISFPDWQTGAAGDIENFPCCE